MNARYQTAIDAGARALHAIALQAELNPHATPFMGLRGQEAADEARAQSRVLAELDMRLRGEVAA